MKIISWNVNGIRAAAKKGLLEWLADEVPDILCVQETKAQPEQLTEALLAPVGYTSQWSSAVRKGYSGVATYYKTEPLRVEKGSASPLMTMKGGLFQPLILILPYLMCTFPMVGEI